MEDRYVDRTTVFELITGERRVGRSLQEFERDLRGRLTRLVPYDRFEEDIEFTVISARRIWLSTMKLA